jgi:hypothetical protein
VAQCRKYRVFSDIGEIKIALCKIFIAQDHKFNFGVILYHPRNGINRKIPDSIQLFIPQHPAINGYFHWLFRGERLFFRLN